MTPPDPLDDLEDRLRRRPVPGLPPGLRARVLTDLAEVARPAPAGAWRFAAGLAAAVLIGLNLVAEARNSFEKAVTLDPENASYNYAMGAASANAEMPGAGRLDPARARALAAAADVQPLA